MLANISMPISIKTRLGNCKLNVSAELRNDKINKLAEYAMQFLIWHNCGSEAFNGKSDYKRDAQYSIGLSDHMQTVCVDVLGEVFDSIKVETSKYEAPDKIAKLIKEFISLGMSEADAKAMAADVQAKT